MRPSQRFILFLLLALFSGTVLIVLYDFLWLLSVLIFVTVIVLVSTDYQLSLGLRLVDLDQYKLEIPNEIYISNTERCQIVIKPVNWINKTPIVVKIATAGGVKTEEPMSVTLSPGKETVIPISLQPTKRGKMELVGIWLYWESPLRFFEFRKYFPLGRGITVHPDTKAVRTAANLLRARDMFFGFKLMNRRGSGTEFKSMVEYQQGMDTRTIDWKQSAKHIKLIAKEYDLELNHHIIVAFDRGYLMSDTELGVSNLDYSINAGLYLSFFALTSGDRVGIFSFGERPGPFLEPLSGIGNFKKIQNTIAEIDYSSEETNFTLGLYTLGNKLQKRSLIIIFSDFVDTITAELMIQNLGYLNRKHLILFVVFENTALGRIAAKPPDSYEDIAQTVLAADFLRERDIVVRKLESLGIHTLVINRKGLSIALLNKYVEIKWRGAI